MQSNKRDREGNGATETVTPTGSNNEHRRSSKRRKPILTLGQRQPADAKTSGLETNDHGLGRAQVSSIQSFQDPNLHESPVLHVRSWSGPAKRNTNSLPGSVRGHNQHRNDLI